MVALPTETQVARTVDDVDGWLAAVRGAPYLAVDTETTGWDPWSDTIRLIQVAAGPDHPVLVVDTAALAPAVLARVLADEAVLKVFHNAAFDLRMLMRAGLAVSRIADTMLAQQLLDGASPEPVGASLQAIARHRLDVELDKSIRDTFMTGSETAGPQSAGPQSAGAQSAGPQSAGGLSDAQIDYAATDARVTWDVFAQQVPELQAAGMIEVARCEFAAVAPLAAMQLRGIGVDAAAWHAVLRRTEEQLPALESAAQDALVTEDSPRNLFGPEPVNLESPEQVLAALARVGVDVDSTREVVLADHADHPAVAAVMAYRQAAKIVHGWGGDWVERARHPRTGRIHSSVRQIVGAGRIAHSDPNLTQIPADPAYRRCFTAEPGNRLIVADYSQQELRVLAAVSGDEALTEVFTSGADLHARTAATVFDVDVDRVTASQRKAAKALNFGLMYGMGAPGFARATGMTITQARQAMDAYFAGFPKVAAWLKHTESTARRTHRVATPLGRVRYLATAGTMARNAPIQGAGADMTKLAVAALHTALGPLGSRPTDPTGLVLTVHDELVVEAPADAAEEWAAVLRRCMVDAGRRVLGVVPAEVDLRIGGSWGG